MGARDNSPQGAHHTSIIHTVHVSEKRSTYTSQMSTKSTIMSDEVILQFRDRVSRNNIGFGFSEPGEKWGEINKKMHLKFQTCYSKT